MTNSTPDLRHIKNLIFDLGQVLLPVDGRLTFEAFADLGLHGLREQLKEDGHEGLLFAFERGEMTPDEFRQRVNQHLPRPASKQAIDKAWNAMLLDYPLERLKLVSQLRQHYRTFLLSNTNRIHWENYRPRMQALIEQHHLGELFEKEFYSHEMGMRKPEQRIYEQVIQETGIAPGESLFIDDREENLRAAENVGIHTLHVTTEYDVLTAFRN